MYKMANARFVFRMRFVCYKALLVNDQQECVDIEKKKKGDIVCENNEVDCVRTWVCVRV
jgi:hypothetical protein